MINELLQKVVAKENLTFDESKQAINEIMSGDVNVYTTPGEIHIENAKGKVSVVNTSGMVVYSNAEPAASQTVNVAAGVYMVTVNGKAAKVIVK